MKLIVDYKSEFSIDYKKKLLFHEELNGEITEFFSNTSYICDEKLHNILNLYETLKSFTHTKFNSEIIENVFKDMHESHISKKSIDTNYYILICNILLNYFKISKNRTHFLLWNCYFFRSSSYMKQHKLSKAIEDLDISIKLVEKIDHLKDNYLMSLWQLAFCYGMLGCRFESINIYHNLSHAYRILKNDVYRIACLFNIASSLNKINKVKILKRYLENTHVSDSHLENYKLFVLNAMEDTILKSENKMLIL